MTPLQQAAQALIDRWLSPSYIAQDVEQLRKALEADLAQSVEPMHVMPHGWVVNWPSPDGGTKPVYHASAIKPKFGGELNGKLTMYPLYTAPTNWTRPINYTPPHMGRNPLTDDEIWKNDTIMSANSGYGATFETLREIVRAVEDAHGITSTGKGEKP